MIYTIKGFFVIWRMLTKRSHHEHSREILQWFYKEAYLRNHKCYESSEQSLISSSRRMRQVFAKLPRCAHGKPMSWMLHRTPWAHHAGFAAQPPQGYFLAHSKINREGSWRGHGGNNVDNRILGATEECVQLLRGEPIVESLRILHKSLSWILQIDLSRVAKK